MGREDDGKSLGRMKLHTKPGLECLLSLKAILSELSFIYFFTPPSSERSVVCGMRACNCFDTSAPISSGNMMKAEATKWREYCWLLHCSLQLFKVLRRDIRVSSKWRGLVKDSGTLQSHLVFLPVSEWWLSLVRQWLTLKHSPPFKTISPLDNKEPRKSVDLVV